MVVKRKRIQRGNGIFDFIAPVNKFLKDTKIVSTVGKAVVPILSSIPQTASFAPIVSSGASAADKLGYGKQRGGCCECKMKGKGKKMHVKF
jgi:hypothetical protein